MGLKILYVGHRNSLCALESAGFTKQNYVGGTTVNTRLDVTTPLGALGGMVAALKADYQVGLADGTTHLPVGLFINNAVGNPFENTPAVASGKAPFVSAMGNYEVDLYETHASTATAVTDPALVYAVGAPLYASKNGLLTVEAPGGATGIHTRVVGYVTKAPNGLDPWLGVQLAL